MFERLLFERMETRVMVGITMFVAVMLIIGWVAINEGPRMAAFEVQFASRSIERGAALFASNCATCHGPDARGLPATAPGLNNPQLFGHSFFADIDAQIATLEEQRPALEAEKQTLLAEWREEGTTRERRQEIQTRVREINTTIVDALGDLQDQRLNLRAAMQNAVAAGYNPEFPSRLVQLGWGGTVENFVYTTLIHGRPTSGAYWPQAMPAWSQLASGPLRNDELQDLAHYILNFDKGADWTMEDLLAVNQFAKVPGAETVEVEGAIGTEVDTILTELETVTGDAARGRAIYSGQETTEGGQILPCSSCHAGGARGPDVVGTWSRINDERLSLDQFAGYTPEHYAVESIVDPNAYVVESFASGVMPTTFGSQLTLQDMADLIAYLRTTG